MVEDSLTARVRHELGAVPEEAARGHAETEPSRARVSHRSQVGHLTSAGAELFDDRADHVGRDFDDRLLVWLLEPSPLVLSRDDPRARDLELVPLPAHRLHEDREVEFASATHGERVLLIGVLDAQRNVALELLDEPLSYLTRRHVLPGSTGERRVVHGEVDRERRLFDGDARQPVAVLRVGQGLPDLDAVEPGQGHDISRERLFYLDAIEAVERVQLRYFRNLGLSRVVHDAHGAEVEQRNTLTDANRATLDAPDRDAPDVGGVVQGGHQHLERTLTIDFRCREMRDDRLEERCQVATPGVRIFRGPPVASHGIQERHVELFVRRLEVHEEFEHLVVDLVDARVASVDLVDDHQR